MQSRASDPEWGPADPRTGAYLDGKHHPQKALLPRVAFIALDGNAVVGYIAGHLTERYACEGELQYLWVAIAHRGCSIATHLLHLLAKWFNHQGATRVCVDVLPENVVARSFYKRHRALDLNTHWLVWDDFAKSMGES